MLRTGNTFKSILAALAITIMLATSGQLKPLQNTLNEVRMGQWPRAVSEQIVFIGIDKKSIDAVGTWPWPRSVHAQAVDKLSKLGASEISFDVDFSTPSTKAEDAILAEALRNSDASVVLPTFLQPGSISPQSSTLVESKPIELFANEAWIASVNVVPDEDGVVRNYSRSSEIAGELVPSLSSVLSGSGRLDHSFYPIDFSISPQRIPTFSLSDLLAGSVPQSAIEGKSILIGAHALELRDNLSVPVYGILPGPVLQILAAETLIQQRVVSRTGNPLIFIVMGLFAIFASLVLPKLRLAKQIISIFALAIILEAVAHYAFKTHAIEITTAPLLLLLLLLAIIRTAGDLDIRSWLLRLAKAEAAHTRLVLDQVFEDSSDAILIIREDGTILEQNMRFQKLFVGVELGEIEQNAAGFLPEKLREEARQVIGKLQICGLEETGLTTRDRLAVQQADRLVHVDYSITPSKVSRPSEDGDGTMEIFFIATITARDVSLEVEQNNRLEYLSRFDERTGAERRNEFIRRLAEQDNESSTLTPIFTIGLLRFDNLVATMGREIGDRLLQALHEKIAASSVHIDGICKLDRESFGIRLAPDTDELIVSDFPHLLLADLADPVIINRRAISLDFCIGYASKCQTEKCDADLMLNQAEFALREAEKQGPNGICEFNAETSLRQDRTRQLEQEMRGALSAGEFYLAYQPQVASLTGAPVGAEALIRWSNPKFGNVSPVEFIDIGETTGMIVRIGQFVLNQACRDAMAWDDKISVSVNVSPIQLSRGDVVQDVQNALKTSGLPAERLVIELTESSFIGDENELLQKLSSLKELGVSIVLDDFGTGYSSLGYLTRFPMDKIKVDQSFVRNIAESPGNQAIVRSIKVLADGFNIKVLCEGVETEDDLRIVQQLGCQEIQGYYFGKPQSTFDIIRYLSEQSMPADVQSPKLQVMQ